MHCASRTEPRTRLQFLIEKRKPPRFRAAVCVYEKSESARVAFDALDGHSFNGAVIRAEMPYGEQVHCAFFCFEWILEMISSPCFFVCVRVCVHLDLSLGIFYFVLLIRLEPVISRLRRCPRACSRNRSLRNARSSLAHLNRRAKMRRLSGASSNRIRRIRLEIKAR